MKLVDDWKRMHKWVSVQCMAVSSSLLAIWPSIPEDLKGKLPEHLVMYVSVALLVLGILGRVIDQGGSDAK